MTSKEALKRIETTFVYNKQRKKNCYANFMSESKVIEEYYKDYNIIKQELEQINNLKRQVIDLKVANKDKYETIKAMKQELLEYSKLRDRFKVLYEKNEQLEKENQELKKSNKELEELYLNENKHWCETIDNLRKENKDLKIFVVAYANARDELLIKNEQLEKIIEILKSNLYIEFDDNYNAVIFEEEKHDQSNFTRLFLKDKQQYNLLKKVLANEKNT